VVPWLGIFLGGGAGACLRVALVLWVDPRIGASFPWGLLAVNTVGCFAIGLVATFVDEGGWLGPTGRAFAVTGLLGGFTTFSSFGLDTFRLASAGQPGLAVANGIGSLVFALLGVAAGVSLARSLL
jgi:CrcB protein